MEELAIKPAGIELCACCFTKNEESTAFCKKCGYPFNGSKYEQDTFIAHRNNSEIDLKDLNKKIKSAGITLQVLAGLFVFWGTIFFFINKEEDENTAFASLIIYLILAFICIGLSLWSKKKPAAALISGLALYVLVLILDAIADPLQLAKGIIIKVLIIGYLIKGIKSALEVDKFKKENNLD